MRLSKGQSRGASRGCQRPKAKGASRGPGGLVVGDTQSDSIQYLNFAKNDSFNIRFNIALPKIQFKILFNSK